MLHSLVVATTLLAPVPQNPKAVPVLGSWMKQYRSGKIDVGNIDKNIAGKSLALKAGLITKAKLERKRKLNYREELILLLEQTAKVNTRKAAELLLEAAAVGLEPGGKYAAGMCPWVVRFRAEQMIPSLSNPAAREYLLTAAKGSPRGPRKLHLALQAAAVKALGSFQDPAYLPVMQEGLSHAQPLVRGHAADGLEKHGAARSMASILTALEKETDEIARDRMAGAVVGIYGQSRGAVAQEVIQRCASIAPATIGEGSWRNDMTVIQLASFARSKGAVPKLIELLARFVEHPEELGAGLLTGRQRAFAYKSLTDLTGKSYEMDDIKGWRDYWQRNKAAFQVAVTQRSLAQHTADDSNATVFGVPVVGSRVLFILDVSNTAMDPARLLEPKRLPAELSGKKRITRLDVMKAELHKAIEGLAPDTGFNVVAAAGPKPRIWRKNGPVPATRANKKSAQKFIKRQGGQAGQGAWSNPYDSIEIGLGIEDQAYGSLGTHNIDEVFMVMVRLAELGKIQVEGDIVRTIAALSQLSKVRFNTAYLGAENDEDDVRGAGKQLMEDLAQATGGKFIRP